jgi:hypothetical protein
MAYLPSFLLSGKPGLVQFPRRAFGDMFAVLLEQTGEKKACRMTPGYSSKSNWGGCVRLNAL